MNDLEILRTLGRNAQAVTPPEVRVVGAVMERIRAGETATPPRFWEWWIATGVSMAAAAVVAVMALQAWFSVTDPLGQWLAPMEVALR